MLSLRLFARAVPRTASRLSAVRVISKPFVAQPSSFLSRQAPRYNFSTSITRREPAGESDQLLSAKFDNERRLEVEEGDPTDPPADVQSFLADSPFKVEDSPGTQLVTLTRQFGNETIKIEFNIADMNNQMDEEYDGLDEDTALPDEDYTTQGKRTINHSGTKGGKIDIAPEDKLAPADGEEPFEDESFDESSYPLGLNITISKPGSGATYIRARAEDGAIEIDNVNYFASADLIEPKTPDQVREAQAIYEGPPFMNLDQELQTMLYQYLEERDINAALATFLPEYVNFKEQREYVQWLENMKKFIDA